MQEGTLRPQPEHTQQEASTNSPPLRTLPPRQADKDMPRRQRAPARGHGCWPETALVLPERLKAKHTHSAKLSPSRASEGSGSSFLLCCPRVCRPGCLGARCWLRGRVLKITTRSRLKRKRWGQGGFLQSMRISEHRPSARELTSLNNVRGVLLWPAIILSPHAQCAQPLDRTGPWGQPGGEPSSLLCALRATTAAAETG